MNKTLPGVPAPDAPHADDIPGRRAVPYDNATSRKTVEANGDGTFESMMRNVDMIVSKIDRIE